LIGPKEPSHREAILSAGLKVMFRSGNPGASVRDICAAAGVPQGSFTDHFRSKGAFAQEVLGRYFANLKESVKKALDDKPLLVGKTA
jgi:TetR/AcrR family transcriptional repressor of nem operon